MNLLKLLMKKYAINAFTFILNKKLRYYVLLHDT
jgi:hypothetical protein